MVDFFSFYLFVYGMVGFFSLYLFVYGMVDFLYKMKNKKYRSVGTIPKFICPISTLCNYDIDLFC